MSFVRKNQQNAVRKSEDSITYYVNADTGSNENPGTSEDRPFKTIQKGIDSVSDVYGEAFINIKKGTYKENLYFNKIGRINSSQYLNLVCERNDLTSELTATAVTDKTVEASGETWTPNEHVGKMFLVTGGAGYFPDFPQAAVIISNTTDTLTFTKVPLGLDTTTEFVVTEPGVIVDSDGSGSSVDVFSNKSVFVKIDFLRAQNNTFANVKCQQGNLWLFCCDGFYNTNVSIGVDIQDFVIGQACNYEGSYTEAAVYSREANSLWQYCRAEGADGSADARGFRADGACAMSIKFSQAKACSENYRAGNGAIIDCQECLCDDALVYGLRADGEGSIEYFDSEGSGNAVAALSFSGGTIFMDSQKLTGTVIFRPRAGGLIVDQADGSEHQYGFTRWVVDLQTENNTPADLLSIPMAAGENAYIDARINAQLDSDNFTTNQYHLLGYFARGSAGNVAQKGSTTSLFTHEDEATWDADLVADTVNQTIDVRVTGAAAADVNWQATVTATEK